MHVGVRLRELDNTNPIYLPAPHEEHSAETMILFMAFTYPIHGLSLVAEVSLVASFLIFLLINLAHLHKLLLQISFKFQATLHIGFVLLESTPWYLQNSLPRLHEAVLNNSFELQDKAISQSTAEGSKLVFSVSPGLLASLSLIIWKSYDPVTDGTSGDLFGQTHGVAAQVQVENLQACSFVPR